MFITGFVTRIKCAFRDKEMIFWTLLFPVMLATLFYFCFSNLDSAESLPQDLGVSCPANIAGAIFLLIPPSQVFSREPFFQLIVKVFPLILPQGHSKGWVNKPSAVFRPKPDDPQKIIQTVL